MRHSKYGLVFIAFATSSAFSLDPNRPEAGAFMRQTEQSLKPSPIQRSLQAPLPQALELSDATVIRADHFNFVGAKRLTSEQLTQVTDQYLNRALNKNDLLHLTESVAARYRQSGWFVRVYIPQQDINQSDISIQILENMPSSAR